MLRKLIIIAKDMSDQIELMPEFNDNKDIEERIQNLHKMLINLNVAVQDYIKQDDQQLKL